MTQAVILAGGFGSRLRSVVSRVPKPMAPLRGKPFLSYLLEDLYQQRKIREILFSVHYKHEMISSYFGSDYKGIGLKYVVEETPLGTGGALKNCEHHLHSDAPFFVLNSDSFLRLSYEQMYLSHAESRSLITLAVKRMPSCSRYGRVLFDEKKRALSFTPSGDEQEGYINAGVYLLEPALLREFPSGPFSFEKDFLQKRVKDFLPNLVFSEGYFIDIGIPEDYARASEEYEKLLSR